MHISTVVIARAVVIWALIYVACVLAGTVLGVPQTHTFRIALAVTCALVLIVGTGNARA